MRIVETELVQIAIGQKDCLSRVLTDKEWDALLESACKHSIVGILWAGIEKLPKEQCPYRKLLIEWYGQNDIMVAQKKARETVAAEFGRLMEKEHVPYVVFKGLAVASKYPKPWLRNLGDIDFYVPPSDFERCVELIERELGVKISRDEADKHYSFTWKDVIFEMHYQMETFGSAKHQSYFNKLVNNCFESANLSSFEVSGGLNVPMLPPMVDIILVFKHWMNHFIGEGVGLRQTIDLAVLMKAYQNQIDIKVLKEYLQAIGYAKAFDAAVALVDRYFAVKWNEYGKLSALSYKYADRLMSDIMKNGNFGRSDYKFKEGSMKRMETVVRFFSHCTRYFLLAPRDIACMVPRRVIISVKAH